MTTAPLPRGERLDLRALDAADLAAWGALADVAAEANPFLRPEFALANSQERGFPLELLVARDGDRWLACLPVRRRGPSARLPLPLLQAMTDEYSFLGVPLLDRDRLGPAADGFLDAVASERRAAAVALTVFAPDGVVAKALRSAAARRGISPVVQSSFTRAAWRRGADGVSPGAHLPDRDGRHLAKRGQRIVDDFGGPIEIVDRSTDPTAWDAFLELENTGWKANRGNPMAARREDAAFFRRMAAALAPMGRFELLCLTAGGRTLAMEAHLIDGDSLYSFKIAYDPAHGTYAPGTQLKARVIDSLHERGFRLADSCASADNAHMNRLWPGRRPLQTLLIPTGAQSTRLLGPILGVRAVGKATRDVVTRVLR